MTETGTPRPALTAERRAQLAARAARTMKQEQEDPLGLPCLIIGADELLAYEAELDALRAALRALREATMDLFGDPDDCDDCADLIESPCRVHGAGLTATRLVRAAEMAEDILGPCRCGHQREEHERDDLRPCTAPGCRCRNFRLPETNLRAAVPGLTPGQEE